MSILSLFTPPNVFSLSSSSFPISTHSLLSFLSILSFIPLIISLSSSSYHYILPPSIHSLSSPFSLSMSLSWSSFSSFISCSHVSLFFLLSFTPSAHIHLRPPLSTLSPLSLSLFYYSESLNLSFFLLLLLLSLSFTFFSLQVPSFSSPISPTLFLLAFLFPPSPPLSPPTRFYSSFLLFLSSY